MGVSTTHRINLSMWILIYSFSDTYYVWAACVMSDSRPRSVERFRTLSRVDMKKHSAHASRFVFASPYLTGNA